MVEQETILKVNVYKVNVNYSSAGDKNRTRQEILAFAPNNLEEEHGYVMTFSFAGEKTSTNFKKKIIRNFGNRITVS